MEESKVEISFHQISGLTSTCTLRFQGSINHQSVLILVDSGSTHNFISDSLVADLNQPIQVIPSFGVTIGNGSVIPCNRICPKIAIRLPGIIITKEFFPFSLANAELI